MKRTKKETRENYLAMMTEMWQRQPYFHLGDMINNYKVSANIGRAILECNLIVKTGRLGYYKWIGLFPTMSDVEQVLSILKSRNKPAPEVVEVSNAVGAAYPKEEIYVSPIIKGIAGLDRTIQEREQEALNILADIMRDNQHITYTLKRIEREVKETETTIL